MNRIHKYPILVEGEFYIEMPFGAKILTVGVQRDQEAYMWVQVDPEEKMTNIRHFFLYATGEAFDPEDLEYVGPIFPHSGNLVFHIYEA
jgi:hypothetical protein